MSSKRIPVYYYKVVAGYAQVDSTLEIIPTIWRTEIPQSIRSRGHSPDVILAMLREDNLLTKCHPIYTLPGLVPYNVRLDRVVLRPEIVPMLNELVTYPRMNPRKEKLIYEITTLCRRIKFVVHVDGDRSNCQSGNLRELSVEPSFSDD